MWNIVKSLESVGVEEAKKLDRNRTQDQERLLKSGLPCIKNEIVGAEEFLSASDRVKELFEHHPERKFFVAVIPKENSENLGRKYTFGITSFEEALMFVADNTLGKDKLYDVKVNKVYDVDVVGILAVENGSAFFEISYGNNLDRLNHGEIAPEVSGNSSEKEIYAKGRKKVTEIKTEAVEMILEALRLLEEKKIRKGYFEIQHPIKTGIYGKVVFVNYIENEAYQRVPEKPKEKDFEIRELLKEKICLIAEEEIRKRIQLKLSEIL